MGKQGEGFCLIIITIFVFCFSLQQAFSFPTFNSKETPFTLPNGLRVLLIHRPEALLLHLVLAVGFGSRDEQVESYGLAHFLEHALLFRGTRSKQVGEIHRDLRRRGVWVNAHTGRDVTLFELSLPPSELEAGLEDFVDLIFNFEISDEDIAREKEIILEEMILEEADPLSLATSIAYENLFPGHPYGHPVIGRKETIAQLSREKIMEAYQTYFVPSNCVLTVVGEFQPEALEAAIKKHFGQLEGKKVVRPQVAAPVALPRTVRIERKTDQANSHLVIAALGPDMTNPDQYAFDVLTTIFSRGINPLLPLALSARRVSVENISAFYYSHRYAGVFLIHLILDPKNLSLAERETIRFLRQASQGNYSPDDVFGEAREFVFDFLGSAKNQIRLVAEKAIEDGQTLASSAAMYLLLQEGKSSPPYLETINRVNSSNLRKVAGQYLGRPELVIITLNPEFSPTKKGSDP